MSFPRLLPSAIIALLLAASSAEAHSTRTVPWSWAAFSNRIHSVVHRIPSPAFALRERSPQDGASALPISTWGRIKSRYREGGQPPPGKD